MVFDNFVAKSNTYNLLLLATSLFTLKIITDILLVWYGTQSMLILDYYPTLLSYTKLFSCFNSSVGFKFTYSCKPLNTIFSFKHIKIQIISRRHKNTNASFSPFPPNTSKDTCFFQAHKTINAPSKHIKMQMLPPIT